LFALLASSPVEGFDAFDAEGFDDGLDEHRHAFPDVLWYWARSGTGVIGRTRWCVWSRCGRKAVGKRGGAHDRIFHAPTIGGECVCGGRLERFLRGKFL
jgi:hypothetical protein